MRKGFFRYCLLSFVLFCSLAQGQALDFEAKSYEQSEYVKSPSYYSMAADLVLARPLLLAATVLGTGIYIVSLPFSLLGGNVQSAGEKLVVNPARLTFTRCLGCVDKATN
ncbi:MAG: multidrug transporter [Gammaproteobacteria bacterium]